MGALVLIQLAVTLLRSVFDSAKVKGVPDAVLADVQAAIDALTRVQGTDVTYSQLEGLRVKTEW